MATIEYELINFLTFFKQARVFQHGILHILCSSIIAGGRNGKIPTISSFAWQKINAEYGSWTGVDCNIHPNTHTNIDLVHSTARCAQFTQIGLIRASQIKCKYDNGKSGNTYLHAHSICIEIRSSVWVFSGQLNTDYFCV